MKVFGVIYLLVNLVNGKMYVGQTTQPLKKRIRKHFSGKQYVDRALRRYGKKGFRCEILKACATKTELDAWEKFFITALKTRAPYGYNLTDGGGGACSYKHTPEICEKISESLSGANHPNYGKSLPLKTCARLSAANRGYSPYKNLLREMDARHLSYSALARLMGFSSHKHVSLKMCGKIRFTERDKTKLVEIFGKPIEYLLARDDG